MDLLLDLGNTRLKWARAQAGVVREWGIVAASSDEAIASALASRSAPDRVFGLPGPGGDRWQRLDAWLERTWGLRAQRLVAAARGGGIVSAYAQPDALGADRWAAMLAAHARFPGAFVVADAGSALTLDAVAADGRHLGGLIGPGLAACRDGLARAAPGLPHADAGAVAPFATNTRDAVRSGAPLMLAAHVRRFRQSAAERLAEAELRLVLTGGDAETLAPLLGESHDIVPQLVLDGMALIAGETE